MIQLWLNSLAVAVGTVGLAGLFGLALAVVALAAGSRVGRCCWFASIVALAVPALPAREFLARPDRTLESHDDA